MERNPQLQSKVGVLHGCVYKQRPWLSRERVNSVCGVCVCACSHVCRYSFVCFGAHAHVCVHVSVEAHVGGYHP